jgi:hypothetical protein
VKVERAIRYLTDLNASAPNSATLEAHGENRDRTGAGDEVPDFVDSAGLTLTESFTALLR